MSEDYQSSIAPRPGFNRSSYSTTTTTTGSGTPSRVLKIVTEMSGGHIASGAPYSGGSGAANAIRDAREREKREISDLNDRLASYIEKVRFLEAQNRKLQSDIDHIRNHLGSSTASVKIIFETEIKTAKTVIQDTGRSREEVERDLRRLRTEVDEIKRKFDEAVRARAADRAKIDELLVKLSNLEAEINLLKRRIALIEDEVARLRKENSRLQDDIQRTRAEIERESLQRLDYSNQVQALLAEIEFTKRANAQEIADLQAQAARDTTNENREYFRNELANAIRDIRDEYDRLNNQARNDLDNWYKKTVQEINTQAARNNAEQDFNKDELKRLKQQLNDLRNKLNDLEARNAMLEKQLQDLNFQLEDDQRQYEAALNDKDAQIRKLRDEIQALMVELQMLLDTKQTLDAEIAIYRKMLEGEGDGPGLKQLVEQVVRTTGINQAADTETMRVVKGETSSRSSYARTAKGNVSVQETAADGSFVLLENTSRTKEEPIGEWKLKRRIDGKREIVFTFPRDFVLAPAASVKVWARGARGARNRPPGDLVFDLEDTFGQGANVHTTLYNKEGEERATHTQRSSTQQTA